MKPTDDQLAVMFRWTLHTRWGVGGFMGVEGEGDDFTCRCKRLESRSLGTAVEKL